MFPTGLLRQREISGADPFKDPELSAALDALERDGGKDNDGTSEEKRQPYVELRRREREQTPVGWTTIGGKASVHKSSFIRLKIAMRLKTAASLVVTRGADARVIVDKKGKKREEFIWKEEDVGGDKWFLHSARFRF